MNCILQLKGRFEQRPNGSKPGAPKLPKGKSVKSSHLRELAQQGALVSVHYKNIVPKSNRLKALLAEGSKDTSESVRGAKFVWEKDDLGKTVQKHVFTHFVKLETLEKSAELLRNSATIIDTQFNGVLTYEQCEMIADKRKCFSNDILSKSAFLKTIVDGNYVERFDIDRANEEITQDSIITIYQTGVETKRLLAKFGINIIDDRIIDGTTLRLTPDEAKLLYNNASYLVAMSLTDFSVINKDDITDEIETWNDELNLIPKPSNEPVIGVIDTQFNDNVYFNEWVDYTNMLDENIPLSEEDFRHGTAVSYIIVDGPQGNPELEDGCGRFRVSHFGVATHKGFSSFAVLRLIRDIVAKNRDIKVWNLSLGSNMEIEENFISPAAAELDRIQYEYDVIFVVAGTNNETDRKKTKIGSPADSLNSIVVNAVSFSGKPASYTRVGPVLDFFYKPDICYYGGDSDEAIRVCTPLGEKMVTGTSFAAPWITRKVAYLIYVMGLSREIAKALIIDAAAGWNRQDISSYEMGYGIVPIKIEDILSSKDNEIKFLLSGTIDDFETYTYNIPVPQDEKGFPFFAKATLAYFPMCDRNQGVDYTSTEMDIHFGRLKEKDGKTSIYPINNNYQSENMLIKLYESNARKLYRKWDNVKHISEELKERSKSRTAFDSAMWGLSIKTKERTSVKAGIGLQFGVVVTLYEMHGVNRINEFKKLCMMRNWLVNTVDIDNRIDVYNMAEEEIELE